MLMINCINLFSHTINRNILIKIIINKNRFCNINLYYKELFIFSTLLVWKMYNCKLIISNKQIKIYGLLIIRKNL